MVEFITLLGDFFYSIFSVLFRYGFTHNGIFVSVGALLISCAIISFIIFAFWRGVRN